MGGPRRPGADGHVAHDPVGGTRGRTRRGRAAARRGPEHGGGGAGCESGSLAGLDLPPATGRIGSGSESARLHRVRAHAGDAAGVSYRPGLLGRLPQRIVGDGRAGERAAIIRRQRSDPGLDGRGRGGAEPAVLPRGGQLRHPVEPDEARAAHRTGGPHRPGARRTRGQLRDPGHGRAPRARGSGREAGRHPPGVRRRQDR